MRYSERRVGVSAKSFGFWFKCVYFYEPSYIQKVLSSKSYIKRKGRDGAITPRNHQYINSFLCIYWLNHWMLIKKVFQNWTLWCLTIWTSRKKGSLTKETKGDSEGIQKPRKEFFWEKNVAEKFRKMRPEIAKWILHCRDPSDLGERTFMECRDQGLTGDQNKTTHE